MQSVLVAKPRLAWQTLLQMIFAALTLGLVLSFALTAVVRRYALSADLLDRPNARSSHSLPTPRGGGVAIVISIAVVVLVLWQSAGLPADVVMALLGSGLTVAFVGFLDDLKPLSARWRFLTHIVAAAWALWAVNGIPSVPLLGFSLDPGWVGTTLAVLYLVWMVNLYNFMDGIDGIAGIEAVTVSAGGALTWWLATGTSYWYLPLAFAACVMGFLIWNLPPAKIFMGDSGSGFIGMVLGLFSVWTGKEVPMVFWCWIILLGCFIVDATTTLVRRVWRGDRFLEAHRTHAYQHASRRRGSHRVVSATFGLINLAWLLPLAILVALGKLDGVVGVLVAYTPLTWLAFRYKAGIREEDKA